jgi:Bacterial Ig domain
MRPLGRLVLAAVCAAAGALTTAAPASAVYEAAFVDQCCYLTLEQGDTAEQFLVFKNTGTETWYRDGAIPVRIGVTNPMERESPFYTAGDWLSTQRPTGLDTASVAPGENGRFTWITTAPQATGTYREGYSPLAELINWMAQGTFVYLDYTVIAAQAPTVKFTATPARVKRGDSFTASVDATDNRSVAKVVFSAGSQEVTVSAPTQGNSGYTATLSSAALGSGTNSVRARAYDPGGRVSEATSAFEVYEGPPPTTTRLSAFTPYFATKTGRRGRLGTLIGLGDVAGLRPGSRLRIVCTKGCVRRVNESRKATSRGRVRLTLRRPLPLLARTRIELRETMPGFVTRFQRYRMRRTRRATLARFVNAGCLSSEKPRTVARCP